MESESWRLERQGRVAIITITRPEVRNAADEATWRHLDRLAGQLVEEGMAALILTGHGDVFMAGADIREFPAILSDPLRIRRYVETLSGALDRLESLPIPVVAAINGPAIGGGLELAVAADYRIAVPQAHFAIPSATMGLALAAADINRLVALVGSGIARALLLFARSYTAPEALQAGLVQEVVDRPQLLPQALALAQRVVDLGPESLRSAKLALQAAVHFRATAEEREAVEASVLAAWNSEWFRRQVQDWHRRHAQPADD